MSGTQQEKQANKFSGGGTIIAAILAQDESTAGTLKPSLSDVDESADNKWRRQPVCDRCFTAKSKSGACNC
jgi:hypothetical protein